MTKLTKLSSLAASLRLFFLSAGPLDLSSLHAQIELRNVSRFAKISAKFTGAMNKL
jgi:hypothetical protein